MLVCRRLVTSLVSQVPSAPVWAAGMSTGGCGGRLRLPRDVGTLGFVEWASVPCQGGVRGNLGFALAGMKG